MSRGSVLGRLALPFSIGIFLQEVEVSQGQSGNMVGRKIEPLPLSLDVPPKEVPTYKLK